MLQTKQLNYLLVGEYHGTVEMPQVAADALCAAANKDRPVVLGVEFTPTIRPRSMRIWCPTVARSLVRRC